MVEKVNPKTTKQKPARRVKSPTVLQMEAVECGAACLAMVMGHYKKFVPLEEVRAACGVSRDGSKASNMLKAARNYGFVAKGFKKSPEALKMIRPPMIAFVNFNHFVVVDGFKGDNVFVNDPAQGRRTMPFEEFDQAFTGVVLIFETKADFKKEGKKKGLFPALAQRVQGAETALAYVVIAGLALVIPGLMIPIFSKIFIDEILIKGMHDWIRPLLLGMALTAILRGGITWCQQYSLLRLETKLAVKTSSQFFMHVLRLPMEFFSQRFAGEIGSRVAINDRVALLLSGELATNFLNLLVIVFYAMLMFFYSPILTAIVVTVASLNGFALKFISRSRVDANMKLLQSRGKVTGTGMAGLMNIETIKANGGESDFFAQWSGYQARLMNDEQKLGVSTQTLNQIPILLQSINTALVLAIGGILVMNGKLTIGGLVAFQSLVVSFLGPVNRLVGLGAKLQEVEGDMNRLDDIFQYKTDPGLQDDAAEEDAGPLERVKLSGHLELRDITFGYNRLETPFIEGFHLTLTPGKRVALVGASGSGKSTISKIVCGLYQPWSGEILFDGRGRNEIPRGILTGSFAFVDQDIFLFEGSIQENLTIWDATIPMSKVLAAAKHAAIHDEISMRANGYESHVEEGGRNFSGGQRQRLEIARALVAEPSLLVMDEATSALDPTTEKIIDDSIRKRGCTCLIVAHRLSTIRDCDEIIVMERGKVVQRGTHEEMKISKGPYASLIKMA